MQRIRASLATAIYDNKQIVYYLGLGGWSGFKDVLRLRMTEWGHFLL